MRNVLYLTSFQSNLPKFTDFLLATISLKTFVSQNFKINFIFRTNNTFFAGISSEIFGEIFI